MAGEDGRLDATLGLDTTEAQGAADELSATLENATQLTLQLDPNEAIASAEELAGTLEGASQLTLALDTTEAVAAADDLGAALDTATQTSAGGLGDTAAAMDNVASSAGGAADQTDGLSGATDALGAAAGFAAGKLGGMGGEIAGLSIGAAKGAVGVAALLAAIGHIAEEGVKAQAADERLNATLGDMADKIEHVHVGTLDADLTKLGITFGSTRADMENSASNIFLIGKNAGLTAEQSKAMVNNLAGLAARSVALKPALGDVNTVMDQMSLRLARGGLFANRLGVSLTTTEIAASAAKLGLEGVDGVLSIGQKTYAASVAAAEKYAGTIGKEVATGADNAANRQKALNAELENFIEESGKTLVVPLFALLSAAIPDLEAVVRVLVQLGGPALKAVGAGLVVATPLLQALADVVEFLGPALGPLITGWVAYEAVMVGIPALLGAAATGMAFLGTTSIGAAVGMTTAAEATQIFTASLLANPLFIGLAAVAGIVAVASALDAFPSSAYDAAAAVKSLTQASDEMQVSIFDSQAAVLAWTQDIPIATAKLILFTNAADENVGTARRLAQNIGKTGENIEDYRKILNDVIGTQKQVNADQKAGADALKDNAAAADDAAAAANALAKSESDLAAAVDDATSSVLAEWDATLKLDKAREDEKDKLNAYNDAVAAHGLLSKEAADASRDWADATIKVAEAAGDAAAKALPKFTDALTVANVKTNATVGELLAVRDTLAAGSPLRASLDQYIAKLLGIPVAAATTLTLDAADAIMKLNIVLGLLNVIAGKMSAVGVGSGGFIAPPQIPTLTQGLDGHWYNNGQLVGQHGVPIPGRPGEMVPILAHAGERVMSVDETARAGGGVVVHSSLAVSINAPIYGVDDLHGEMAKALDAHDRELERSLRVLR